MIDVNAIRDPYNRIRIIEKSMHGVKTMHSLGRINISKAKRKLRSLEQQLQAALEGLPETEKYYYYYQRLYGHPTQKRLGS